MLENKFNYTSSVEYDYNTYYSCEESGCFSEGICRCGVIENASVTNIDINKLSSYIYGEMVDLKSTSGKRENRLNEIFYGGETVDMYCIHRILSINKIYDVCKWEVGVEGGYYGQEIGDIFIDNKIFDIFKKQIEQVLEFDNLTDKIKFILELEYGFLLPELKDVEFELIEVSKDMIDLSGSNQKHIRGISVLPYYLSEYKLPRGVVKKSKDKFKIIDGFHRIVNFLNNMKDEKHFNVFCIK
jgi:hypothetical protein